MNSRSSGTTSTPSARRRSATDTGRFGDDQPARLEALHRAGAQLRLDLVPAHPALDQLVEPQLVGVDDLDVRRDLGDPDPLHRGDHRDPAAVELEVGERVDDPERELVTEGGGAVRVPVNQDVGRHGRQTYLNRVMRFLLRVALPASSTAVTVTTSRTERRAGGQRERDRGALRGQRGRRPRLPARLGAGADQAGLARAARLDHDGVSLA